FKFSGKPSTFHPHAQRNACSHRCDYGWHCSLNRWIQTALSSFQKRSQLLIGTHNETLSVAAVCVNNPDCSRLTINGRNAAPIHPALLRLSAIISQYFKPLPLVVVLSHLRRGFVQLKLCVYSLQSRA